MVHKKYIRRGESPVKECGHCGTVWRDSDAAKSMMLSEISYDKSTGAATKHAHNVKCKVDPAECPFCGKICENFEKISMSPRKDRYTDPDFELEIIWNELNELREKLDDIEQDESVELPPVRLYLISEITQLEIKLRQINENNYLYNVRR